MTLTPEQLFELQVLIGRRLIAIDEMMLFLMQAQQHLAVAFVEAIPNDSEARKKHIRVHSARCENALEQLEAFSASFKEDFEKLLKKS